MPSAEDTASSTASPPAGSSNSAQEEFPVEPLKKESDKSGPSPSVSEGANHIALSTSTSPEDPPAEPGEDAASPLKTKPLPRVTAVAQEIRVVAAGARAGNVSGERELFTESTTTVLVFEKGAVIRLTAAVTPGQLLFLTNEESKREVVTQVVRKRTHRPTECYVELEFTEPAPGFWRMEFSAATALLPKDAKVIAAAEMISSAETTDDELDEAAPPPSAEQVQALKKEVDALRSQLKLLQTEAQPGQTESSATPSAPPAPPADTQTRQAEVPSYSTEKVAWSELTAPAFPTEREPKPGPAPTVNPELAKPALVFRKALPTRKRSFRARGQFTPGFRAGMLRLALLSSILGALIATAWYKRWLPWAQDSKKISVSSLAGVTTAVSVPEAPPSNPAPVEPQTSKTSSENGASVSVKETSHGTASSRETAAEAVAGNENGISSLPSEVIKKPAVREKKTLTSIAKPSLPQTLPTKVVDSVPTSAPTSAFVPPRLLKSERAVASLDDLRDFETGSVLIDAIIDAAGNVTSMNVLKGPPSLRGPALEALKNYKYLPAVQNGKPVAAHVTVKIQFRFE